MAVSHLARVFSCFTAAHDFMHHIETGFVVLTFATFTSGTDIKSIVGNLKDFRSVGIWTWIFAMTISVGQKMYFPLFSLFLYSLKTPKGWLTIEYCHFWQTKGMYSINGLNSVFWYSSPDVILILPFSLIFHFWQSKDFSSCFRLSFLTTVRLSFLTATIEFLHHRV